MNKIIPPQDQVFWYLNKTANDPLRESIECDVIVVGGGMAGLSAVQAFANEGKKVVLLEQYYCGSGASGKSSGFITPNSELSLTHFVKEYGTQEAKKIWDFINSGVRLIESNIKKYQIDCDYISQDALVLANSKKELQKVKTEYINLEKMGYDSSYIEQSQLQEFIGSNNYFGAVRYGGSFGINSYNYCQAMKKILQEQGVAIYEETPVLAIENNKVITKYATAQADHIVVCVDRFLPELNLLKSKVYHTQTFLLISQILSDSQIKQIFPHKQYMAWDTDLIYTYFRLTGDHRLLVGGGNLLSTYSGEEYHHYHAVEKKLSNYMHKKFDVELQFQQVWPGLIGVSKDIAPLAGPDKDNPAIYYISACAGLPFAAALGMYSAQHIVHGARDLDRYFDPNRSFMINDLVQKIIGTKATFAICDYLSVRKQ
jgi:gamma-glutamylputrescine oxidase